VRQVVLLAAGLDTRAFRLSWPAGTSVFELDQPQVFAHKEAVLEASGATATCDRRVVEADLRVDWPRALVASGFDQSRPTVWVAEGLMFYLPEVAVRGLLDDASHLSAHGSHLVADFMSATPGPPQQFKDLFASLGAPFVFATDDPAALVRSQGWDAEVLSLADVAHRLGTEIDNRGRIVLAHN
jgi:methyltransferase (TIGR00027 family)